MFVTFHAPHEQVAAPEKYTSMYADIDDPTKRDYYGSVSLIDARGRPPARGASTPGGFASGRSSCSPATTARRSLLGYPKAIHSHGSAGPLRGNKLSMYEGGYRVPAILRWPGQAKPGTESAEPAGFFDLLPTLCAVAGVAPPTDRTLDGVNVLPLLEGRPVEPSPAPLLAVRLRPGRPLEAAAAARPLEAPRRRRTRALRPLQPRR